MACCLHPHGVNDLRAANFKWRVLIEVHFPLNNTTIHPRHAYFSSAICFDSFPSRLKAWLRRSESRACVIMYYAGSFIFFLLWLVGMHDVTSQLINSHTYRTQHTYFLPLTPALTWQYATCVRKYFFLSHCLEWGQDPRFMCGAAPLASDHHDQCDAVGEGGVH